MATKVLVIGGTGMLGEPVARRLHADGYQVRIFTRNMDKALAQFGAEYEVAAGNVEDQLSLNAALQNCQTVHINLEGGLDPDLERRGAENVVAAAAKAGIQRITYLSGTSVTRENCWYAGTKAKFEAEAAIRASGVPYTIFQATFFMETLPRFVRGTRASILGSQPHPWHWAAAVDYARMVSKAYVTPGAANKTLHIFGPESWTTRQALQTYCSIARPDAKVGAIPFWMASLIASLSRDKTLQAALPFFRYSEKVSEAGDPAEANALLGAPTTTLEQWCRQHATRDTEEFTVNATLLNGALPGDSFVDAVAAALQEHLQAAGWTVTPWTLRDAKLAYCLGCFECWTKTPGLCRIDDAGREVARSVIGSDLAIYLTPITFGGYSSELKKAVDRCICLVSPFFTHIEGEVHHHARYARYPSLLGVGVLPAPHAAQERIFRTLLARNAINLHAPTHNSAIIYRSQEPAAVAAALRSALNFAERVPA